MKQTPEFDRIQQQMQPGIIALDGFLGDDKRKLIEIGRASCRERV